LNFPPHPKRLPANACKPELTSTSTKSLMPTYVYEVVENGQPTGERFEVVQSMSDEPLTKHPESGKPVRRVILPPHIGGKYSDGAMNRSMANDGKLDKLGFTKYVKSGDGTYEKAFGSGPKNIQK